VSATSSPVAAIDIGTNSVLLLVAEARGGGLVALREEATITRLGEGVDRTRTLAEAAIERTLACLERYAAILRELGVSSVAAVGTSAMRDAAGGDAFRRRATEILGAAPRTISGDEEAALTYEGTLVGIERDPARPVLVFDVGGGSTEFILGEGGAITSAKSLDIGSVRLTERHVRSDPPTELEVDAVRADVQRALATLHAAPPADAELVGVAGTVTSLLAVARGVDPYDAAKVHGAHMGVAELDATVARLRGLTTSERSELPGLSPKRADVIVAGALLVREVIRWAGASEVVVSDRGVRWGLALRLADGRTS
jgi:exopolyphosphatase/guanosine-5'-triphosphate,3'-diphosphate pyrophosphatase